MSHFDSDGNPRLVDVSAKTTTVRLATAQGCIRMGPTAASIVKSGTSKKGDVLAVARLAAIQATKLTSQLIPLCHAIPIESVDVEFDWVTQRKLNSADDRDDDPEDPTQWLQCRVTTRTTGKTGVEMEALTGVSVGCLTVYDMLKFVDREISISDVQLIHKSGGKSGDFTRND